MFDFYNTLKLNFVSYKKRSKMLKSFPITNLRNLNNIIRKYVLPLLTFNINTRLIIQKSTVFINNCYALQHS